MRICADSQLALRVALGVADYPREHALAERTWRAALLFSREVVPLRFSHVRAHQGHRWNERADYLAGMGAREQEGVWRAWRRSWEADPCRELDWVPTSGLPSPHSAVVRGLRSRSWLAGTAMAVLTMRGRMVWGPSFTGDGFRDFVRRAERMGYLPPRVRWSILLLAVNEWPTGDRTRHYHRPLPPPPACRWCASAPESLRDWFCRPCPYLQAECRRFLKGRVAAPSSAWWREPDALGHAMWLHHVCTISRLRTFYGDLDTAAHLTQESEWLLGLACTAQAHQGVRRLRKAQAARRRSARPLPPPIRRCRCGAPLLGPHVCLLDQLGA